MISISHSMQEVTSSLAPTTEAQRKIYRANQVRNIWKDVIIKVFGSGAHFILTSTNAVYILSDKGFKQLIVYAEDSMVRDSLLNMREFIIREFACAGEDIEEYIIRPSRYDMKNRHPFQEEFFPELEQLENKKFKNCVRKARLTRHQQELIKDTAKSIEDPVLRVSFEKAMTACFKSYNV